MTPAVPVSNAVHHLGSASPIWFVHRAGTANLQLDLCALIELLGGSSSEADACDDGTRFAMRHVARGTALVHEGAQARGLFIVQSGCFKCTKTAEDGYEHVLSFAWRRDVIGYDAMCGGHYAFGAEALEDSAVVALPIAALAGLRARSPALDAALQTLVARQLAHAGEIAEVMSAVSAETRVTRFLCQLSDRMAERGESAYRLRLRMSRRDIANHLGLAHETISRSLHVLAERGCLSVDSRDVEILDLAALKTCARSTRHARGAIDGPMPSRQQELACAA